MFFLPFSLLLFLFFILLLPVLFFLFQAGIVALSFSRLGLTPTQGFLIFFLSLSLSTVNIPIKEYTVSVEEEFFIPDIFRFFFNFPDVSKKIIAVNVGGCLIPLLLSIYILPRLPLLQTLIATLLMVFISYSFSRYIPGIGVVLPAFIPPIFAATIALILAPKGLSPLLAYFSGTIGTLIGADILNLPKIISSSFRGVMSIGGAGVYDGIFLVGIIALLLA
ncbi:MAG: hypothetical protein DRI36_03975 [Caldiserica bacterium]|nr:MAG: hypothetical protein DRI36_03975 [Caldisericota bacterium]